ncbi:MAG: 7,8-didemethyl-8-hydroxy-5-deazariboflavin synthase subunit CofG [Cyanobacteria bacterium QS_8_64_29]|nr:MAG: 7,8-didemethyl-8-hydroxy-5-deazariboflavin synthase subunit CofG [Cyanobacteria bacterium QS_8_64_29]
MPAPTVTYSPAYTLVPTYECFNRCTYCNFRLEPGQGSWLSLAAAQRQLARLQASGTCEILLLSGEVHPRSPQRGAWLQRIADLAELALAMGFLPHANVGPLQRAEMAQLKQMSVSMGLMLEQLTPALLQTVHRQAPSKEPQWRLQQLAWAGELQIPFTTGVLLGIGETAADREATLGAIARLHRRWGHIQEVILQPHSLGSSQAVAQEGFDLHQLPTLIARARALLPADIAIQFPPNLVGDRQLLLDCLAAGARDLGGIGPTDEVNPNYPHHQPRSLAALLAGAGWQLVPRLPVYPQYLDWLLPPLQAAAQRWQGAIAP